VLVFGKDLPQAASKAYLQARKLRNAVDDLRRDSGIDQEIRNIERTVREAEWEARRSEARATGGEARRLTPVPPVSQVPRPPSGSAPAGVDVPASADVPGTPPASAPPTDAAS